MTQANRTTLNLESHTDFRYKNESELKKVSFERAMEYLREVYDFTDELQEHFDKYELKYSKTCRFSKHVSKRKSAEPVKIRICLNESKWYTYNRKSIGKVANGITLPRLLKTTLATIHEYTHAIQLFRYIQNGCTGQRAGEVETTLNELHYVETVSPTTMNRLDEIKSEKKSTKTRTKSSASSIKTMKRNETQIKKEEEMKLEWRELDLVRIMLLEKIDSKDSPMCETSVEGYTVDASELLKKVSEEMNRMSSSSSRRWCK